ncbi:MAG: hypothetical protein KGL79_07440 [Acidobacteriota bacterium]|nr:hypothetical protein [Acidobacteriota bacterium]
MNRVWRRWLTAIAVVILTPSVWNLAPAHSAPTSGAASPSTYAVGLARCVFVDGSRTVLNFATNPASTWRDERRLVTEIRYPVNRLNYPAKETAGAVPEAKLGGYPTVIFAHGYDVTPDLYAALLDAWVRAGYVVVAPWFPDEVASAVAEQHGVNTEGDLANEPADLAFVAKSAISAAAGTSTGCSILRGLVDASRLAFAGHSDGATAVGMLMYDHGLDPQGVNYASLRTGLHVGAVMIFSGSEDTHQAFATPAAHPALLVVHSLGDTCNPLSNGRLLYDQVHQGDKWFLELQKAHHLPPFDGTDVAAFRVVSTTSILFLQSALDSSMGTQNLTTSFNPEPAVAQLFHANPGPPLPPTFKTVRSCSRN